VPVIPEGTSGPHAPAPRHTPSTLEARGVRPGLATRGHRVDPPGCSARGSASRVAHHVLEPNASTGSRYVRLRLSGPCMPIAIGHRSPPLAVNMHGLCCCGQPAAY
jgi:hypothetical protein